MLRNYIHLEMVRFEKKFDVSFVIDPDGVISSLVLGEMDEADLDAYVQKARDEAETRAGAPVAVTIRRFGT